MPRSQAMTHTAFDRSVKALDVFQRIYMRLTRYFSPTSESRTVFGALMTCNTRDFVQRRVRFFKVFEHNLTYYTLARLRPGDVYLDIGANVGYFSLLAAGRVGAAGRVISVEADPVTFRALERNVALNGYTNVDAMNVAATATACRVAIERRDSANSGANAIVVTQSDDSVAGLPFEALVGEDLGRVRFIKIDIEGSEAPILDRILARLPDLPADLVVASEVGETSGAYVEAFAAAGFRCFAIPNVYTIDYYLIRSYLRLHDEDRTFRLIPVTTYDARYTDYVFER